MNLNYLNLTPLTPKIILIQQQIFIFGIFHEYIFDKFFYNLRVSQILSVPSTRFAQFTYDARIHTPNRPNLQAVNN